MYEKIQVHKKCPKPPHKYIKAAILFRWYYWADKLGMLVWQDFPCITDTMNIDILIMYTA